MFKGFQYVVLELFNFADGFKTAFCAAWVKYGNFDPTGAITIFYPYDVPFTLFDGDIRGGHPNQFSTFKQTRNKFSDCQFFGGGVQVAFFAIMCKFQH